MTRSSMVQLMDNSPQVARRQTLAELIDSVPDRRMAEFDEYYAEECRQWNLISAVAVFTFVSMVLFVMTAAVGRVLGWW